MCSGERDPIIKSRAAPLELLLRGLAENNRVHLWHTTQMVIASSLSSGTLAALDWLPECVESGKAVLSKYILQLRIFGTAAKIIKKRWIVVILHCSYICILNAKGGHPVHTVLFTCQKIWNIRQPLSEIDLQGTGSIKALPSLLCVLFSWSSFLFPCEALGVNSQVLRLVSWWKRKQ